MRMIVVGTSRECFETGSRSATCEGWGLKMQWPPLALLPLQLNPSRGLIGPSFRGPLRANSGQVRVTKLQTTTRSPSTWLHRPSPRPFTEVGRMVPAGSCGIGPARWAVEEVTPEPGSLSTATSIAAKQMSSRIVVDARILPRASPRHD